MYIQNLDDLKETLYLAKEENDLTVSNISKIVSEMTRKIIKKSKFNKDKIDEIVKDVSETTLSILSEFGELTDKNIEATNASVLNGVQKSLKDEIDFNVKRFRRFERYMKNREENKKINFRKIKGK